MSGPRVLPQGQSWCKCGAVVIDWDSRVYGIDIAGVSHTVSGCFGKLGQPVAPATAEHSPTCYRDPAHHACAVARVEALTDVLSSVEWGPVPHCATNYCPWCLQTKSVGHAEDCRVSAALAVAGENDAASGRLTDRAKGGQETQNAGATPAPPHVSQAATPAAPRATPVDPVAFERAADNYATAWAQYVVSLYNDTPSENLLILLQAADDANDALRALVLGAVLPSPSTPTPRNP